MAREETVETVRRPTPLDPYQNPVRPRRMATRRRIRRSSARMPLPSWRAHVPALGRCRRRARRLGRRPRARRHALPQPVGDASRGPTPSVIKSRAVDYYSAAFYLTNPEVGELRPNTLALRRFRFVGNGLLEQLVAANAGLEPASFELRLACGTDFADLFEMKSAVRDGRTGSRAKPGSDGRSVRFSYEARDSAQPAVRVVLSRVFDAASLTELAQQAVRVEGDNLVWELELEPRELLRPRTRRPRAERRRARADARDFGEQQRLRGRAPRWLDAVPAFESDSAELKAVFDKSIVDLAALRIEGTLGDEPYVLPAAGLPGS